MDGVIINNYLDPGLPIQNEISCMDAGFSRWQVSMRSPAWQPPTDVFETDGSIIVRVEIAGMRQDCFSIELEGRYLSIYGTRPDIRERRAFHQMEIRFGEFNILLELPQSVDSNQIEAIYNNGFLRIELPKSLPRHIPID